MVLANLTAVGGNAAVPVSGGDPGFRPEELLLVHALPAAVPGAVCPEIQAKAGLVTDVRTGIRICAKNVDTPLPMASLTKIMTAILILEDHAMNEVVTVQNDFSDLEGVRIWLRYGEKLTVYDLLQALLIRSAGDAAIALAEHHSGDVASFVASMNHRADQLGLTETRFVNPVGLDADGHHSSADDLALMTRYALRFPEFREIIRRDKARITSTDGKIDHSFDSTNYLLGSYLDIAGVKTGTTDLAGQSLINLARDENGNEILSILLNSPQRFQENKGLIDWTFRHYRW
jgi:D-alanyl-D-alanine carboxypeptidase